MSQPALFTEIAVGCIFCPHVVRRSDPAEAHEAMEEHYRADHQAAIDRIVEAY